MKKLLFTLFFLLIAVKLFAAPPAIPGIPVPSGIGDGETVCYVAATKTFTHCSPGGEASISNTAYDADTWNGVTTIAPSKDAVRDKIETIVSSIPSNAAHYLTDQAESSLSAEVVVSSAGKAVVTAADNAAIKTLLGYYTSGDTFVGALTGNVTGYATDIKSPATTGLARLTGMGAGTTRVKTVSDANDTILEAGGSYSPSGTWNFGSATVTLPTPFTLGATSVTTTGAQINYLKDATGTTGTASQKIVFDTSPTLVTPNIGVATATSVNKYTFTAPATGATLAIADGKTLTVNKTLTFGGTDSTVFTFPSSSGTVALSGTLTNSKWCTSDGTLIVCNTDAPTGAGTITAVGDITSGPAFTADVPGKTLVFNNATSGTVTVQATTGALGTRTISLPAETGTICTTGSVCTGYQASITRPVTGPSSPTANNLVKYTGTGQGTDNTGVILGTMTDGYYCTYTSSGTLLSCNTQYATASNLVFGSDTQDDVAVRGASAYARLNLTEQTVLGRVTGGHAAALAIDSDLSSTSANDDTIPSAKATKSMGDLKLALAGGTMGGNIAMGGNSITGIGSLGATGARITKVWTADIESTGMPTVGGTSLSLTFQGLNTNLTNLAALTNSAGSLTYGTGANTFSVLAAGTQGKMLQMGATNPGWSAYTMPASIATGDVMYGSGTNAVSALTAGSAGAFLRQGASTPAWSTVTIPATVAAGSILATNSANVLAAVTSTSGTKYLTNTDGTITWGSLSGAVGGTTGSTDNAILRADGTGGATAQSSIVTIDDSGNVVTTGTITATAFVSTGGADGTNRIELLNNTTRTPAASEYSLYFEGGTDLKFALNGSEKTVIRSEDAQTITGAKTFTGGIYSGDASTNAGIRFYDGSSNYWTLIAPTGMSTNPTFKLPTAQAAGSGYYLYDSDGAGTLAWGIPAAGAAGSDTQVQFNDGGTNLGGDAGFVYNKTTQRLTIGKNGTGGGIGLYNELGASDYTATIVPNAGQVAAATITLPPATAYLTGGNVTLAGPTSTRRTYTGPDADATLVTEGTATGGIVLGDSTPDANGEIGYASNAYNFFANSEDMVITAGTNLWTFSSNTGATFAFTPAVSFAGNISSGNAGTATNLSFSDTDVTHGITTVTGTNNWFLLDQANATKGGAQLHGFSDATDQSAMSIRGYSASDPDDGIAAVGIRGYAASGTGVTALAAGKTVFGIYNNTTLLASWLGNGTLSLGNNPVTLGATGYIAMGADPADSGAVRLSNNTAIGWEQATPGTDIFIALDSSNVLQVGQNAASIALGTSGTGNVTVTGDLTVTGADVTIGATGVKISSDNDGAITFASLGGGNSEDLTLNLDDTANTVVVSSSTGVTDISFSAINLVTTGNVAGGVNRIGSFASPITSTGTYSLTAANAYNSVIFYNDTDTLALPAAVAGMNLCIYVTGTNLTTVDVDGTDVMVVDGTANGAGDAVTIAGAAGNYLCLIADAANHWVTMGSKGTITAQ